MACKIFYEPLHLLLLFIMFSNTHVGCIIFRGSRNKGPDIKVASSSFIFCFNSKFSLSIVSIGCFKDSLVAPWNYAIFYGETPLKSIDDFHFSYEIFFLAFTFSNNNFLDSQL
jgi:hypothetical protein